MSLASVHHRVRRLPSLRFSYRPCTSTKHTKWSLLPTPTSTIRRWSSTSDPSKPYYITTPIFYPNAKPHIGHLYTLVLGDVLARYRRLVEPQREVKFLVGTDEHGLKIQQAAAKSGKTREDGAVDVQGFCDELSEVFKNLSKSANISYTTFARTTQDRHLVAVEHVWRTLNEKGFIYKGEYEGWYSVTDECFYTTPQVTETADGTHISKETGSTVEWSKEYNYMFRLSAFRDALVHHYSSNKDVTAVFPSQYNSVVLGMLSPASTDEPGLVDISISRPRSRLTWGITVPEDPEHTVYVWFDALLIYLSGVGYPWSGAGAQAGWPADMQIIGKDILRFHAIYLPAILLALSGPKYSELVATPPSKVLEAASIGLPKRLLTHAHWTVSQAKMSKSVGNVVDPIHSMETYGVDIVRYYLARVGGRFRDDVDWSFEQLENHSKQLQSLLGNYLLRVASARITASAAVGRDQLQDGGEAFLHSLNEELFQAATKLPGKVQSSMEALEVADALVEVLDVLKLANKAVTDIAPWSKACDPRVVYETRQTALLTLRVAGVCLKPFVPETSERLLEALGLSEAEKTWESVLALDGSERTKEREVKAVRLF
ncbi:tRNA synthetases class I (M)-domain-containing protein [Ephemerocybe angulata]|uniref:Probable methionine--tRNA ligase, mitochondrial n=1 Tax=Ephemerocybe angulata TaxID=980116 RepID=A0A8H6HNF8_9AGAR|nr:tRNA synthetases class I (M)-domain-containing protein [Tulosesus angulatus]